jgi:eukaryotic translation initiation factor 2C
MDGAAGHYRAHISCQNERRELHQNLTEAVSELLEAFRRTNSCLPHNIVVYRDGVGEGNFEEVLKVELVAIQAAVENAAALCGQMSSIPISIVICQKSHNSRFVYGNGTSSDEFVNLCPGICVDAAGGSRSVTSMVFNEFYINSHVAIQGTAKPCRYTLLFDQIGFKVGSVQASIDNCCYFLLANIVVRD